MGAIQVLFIIDPLPRLNPEIDATIGLMLAAQALDAGVWVCEPEELAYVDGSVRCWARRLELRTGRRNGDHRWIVEAPWWRKIDQRVLDVARDFDLVQLRIDPPVDGRYLHTTYLLDLVEAGGVQVVNRPSGIRALHEKFGVLPFPDLCPETMVSSDPIMVRSFVSNFGAAVIKPVDGFAGNDVWLVRDDPTAASLIESATSHGARHVIAQRYLEEVASGNKRLFVLDGEIIGSVLRRPDADDFRIGPPVSEAEVDGDDLRIVATLSSLLAEHGIRLAGLDVIGGRLIEINVTCPGGMHKTDALLDADLSGLVMRRLLQLERVSA